MSSSVLWPRVVTPAGRSVAFRDPRQAAFRRLMDLPMLVFIASLAFETVGGSGTEEMTLTISKVLGFVWAATCIFDPFTNLRQIHRMVGSMVLFVTLYFARGLLVDKAIWPEAIRSCFMLVQMTALIWLILGAARSRPQLYRKLGWTFGLSCVVLAVLQILGVTQTELVESRISALGEDPNTLSGKLAIGLVLIVGLTWNRRGRAAWAVVIIAVPAITLTILRSGSRGGLVALLGGLAVLAVPGVMGRNKRGRLKRVALVIVAAGALVFGISATDVVSRRWGRTFGTFDMARRELLYPRTFEMVMTRPAFGWGPVQNYSAVSEGLNDGAVGDSTENTFMWALTAVGLVGAAPFLYAIHLVGRAAWSLRRTPLGWTPIAVLATTILFSCTIEWQHNKVYWLVLGLTIAAAEQSRAHSPTKHLVRSLQADAPSRVQ